MACRKSAYNALMEMSEYVERQSEHASVARAKLEAEQRQIWTPAEILEKCCVLWLSDGSEVVGHRTNHHIAKGCSGGCGKDHPRVTLEFHETDGSTALLSHAFNPFVKHFEELCELGLASRMDVDDGEKPKYKLKGFLLCHDHRLRRSTRFGYHLVKVSPLSLAASRRAHDRQVEESEQRERCEKKRRIEAAAYSTNERNIFEQVLQICYENGSLLGHLNVLDISWMRLSGDRALMKLASQLASTRLRQLRLTYSASVRCLDGVGNVHDPSSFFNAINVTSCPLSLKNSEMRPGVFVPFAEHQIISWDFNYPNAKQREIFSSHVTLILRIKVRLEGADHISMAILHELPEKDCMFQQPIEVGWYQLDLPINILEDRIPEGPFTISSQQTPCSKMTVEISPVGLNRGQGSLSLRSLSFGFQHLVGIYARKKLPLAKQRMLEIKKERPVLRAEKDYVMAVAKAAREAPGRGERTFLGLMGWP
jgi:hypothetical protein